MATFSHPLKMNEHQKPGFYSMAILKQLDSGIFLQQVIQRYLRIFGIIKNV